MTSIAASWAVGTPQTSDWGFVWYIKMPFKRPGCIIIGRNLKGKGTSSNVIKYIYLATMHELQSWPEHLGHKGNKPVKMTYFLPPPPPDAMLMSGIQVIFGRLNIAWGEGGTKEMVY